MIDTSAIRERFTAVKQDLSERSRRLLAAAEAKTAGYGGITAASRATGVARSTIGRGLQDLAALGPLSGAVRRPGGGCPTLTEKDPTLLDDLRRVLEPATMGDPMRPLMWVSKRYWVGYPGKHVHTKLQHSGSSSHSLSQLRPNVIGFSVTREPQGRLPRESGHGANIVQ